MKLLDSRRVTGPGLLLDGPGAVLDVALDEPTRDRAIAAWRDSAARMLAAVGLREAQLETRHFQGGATLGFTAPPDALYTATDTLTLSANGSYNDATYKRYNNAPCPVGVTGVCDLSGKRLFQAPEWVANGTID